MPLLEKDENIRSHTLLATRWAKHSEIILKTQYEKISHKVRGSIK